MKKSNASNIIKYVALKKPGRHMNVVVSLAIFISVVSCHLAHAQFNQGRLLAGGAVAFNASTLKDDSFQPETKYTLLSIAPNVGYFVINNLAVGLDANLLLEKSTTGSQSAHATSILAGPFVRYYLKPGIFFQGEYQLGSDKITTDGGFVGTTTESMSSWALSIGYALFLNEHVALEPMVSYKSYTLNQSSADYKSINSGLNIGLGFQIYLGKSSK